MYPVMKVTVTFGDTAVVVPCKAGWTVRDLTEQATRRYRRILEQDGRWRWLQPELSYLYNSSLFKPWYLSGQPAHALYPPSTPQTGMEAGLWGCERLWNRSHSHAHSAQRTLLIPTETLRCTS
ncbi:hypothetical protein INR49_026039 [Caranx melampygus]|nr:hypothetical protein INR49_026039 [Caranx melampygus]